MRIAPWHAVQWMKAGRASRFVPGAFMATLPFPSDSTRRIALGVPAAEPVNPGQNPRNSAPNGPGDPGGIGVEQIYHVKADDRRRSYTPVGTPAHSKASGWAPKVVPSGVDDAQAPARSRGRATGLRGESRAR